MKIMPVNNVDEVLKIALKEELKPVEWIDIKQNNSDEESKNITSPHWWNNIFAIMAKNMF